MELRTAPLCSSAPSTIRIEDAMSYLADLVAAARQEIDRTRPSREALQNLGAKLRDLRLRGEDSPTLLELEGEVFSRLHALTGELAAREALERGIVGAQDPADVVPDNPTPEQIFELIDILPNEDKRRIAILSASHLRDEFLRNDPARRELVDRFLATARGWLGHRRAFMSDKEYNSLVRAFNSQQRFAYAATTGDDLGAYALASAHEAGNPSEVSAASSAYSLDVRVHLLVPRHAHGDVTTPQRWGGYLRDLIRQAYTKALSEEYTLGWEPLRGEWKDVVKATLMRAQARESLEQAQEAYGRGLSEEEREIFSHARNGLQENLDAAEYLRHRTDTDEYGWNDYAPAAWQIALEHRHDYARFLIRIQWHLGAGHTIGGKVGAYLDPLDAIPLTRTEGDRVYYGTNLLSAKRRALFALDCAEEAIRQVYEPHYRDPIPGELLRARRREVLEGDLAANFHLREQMRGIFADRNPRGVSSPANLALYGALIAITADDGEVTLGFSYAMRAIQQGWDWQLKILRKYLREEFNEAMVRDSDLPALRGSGADITLATLIRHLVAEKLSAVKDAIPSIDDQPKGAPRRSAERLWMAAQYVEDQLQEMTDAAEWVSLEMDPFSRRLGRDPLSILLHMRLRQPWPILEEWHKADLPSQYVSGKKPEQPSLFSLAPSPKAKPLPPITLYVGQTRSKKLIQILQENGIRELTQRYAMPPKRYPYAIDNGCFDDYLKGQAFSEMEFDRKVLWWALDNNKKRSGTGFPMPDFITVPDLPLLGMESLEYSKKWYLDNEWRYAEFHQIPWYFVTQNGMDPESLDLSWGQFAGIFIGGSVEWKYETGEAWVKYAHERNMKCHIGRAATVDRILWARRIGADSVDGNGPLWTEADTLAAISAVRDQPRQGSLL